MAAHTTLLRAGLCLQEAAQYCELLDMLHAISLDPCVNGQNGCSGLVSLLGTALYYIMPAAAVLVSPPLISVPFKTCHMRDTSASEVTPSQSLLVV